MRLFVAVALDDGMKDALTEASASLRRLGVEGNYSKRENYHITLAFIGDHPDPGKIAEILREVDFTPFEISLSRLGSFGNILWAGMDGTAPLAALAKRVRHALSERGVMFDEKKFTPHITLVRKRSGAQPDVTLAKERMTVKSFSLFKSDLYPSGPVYTELETFSAKDL